MRNTPFLCLFSLPPLPPPNWHQVVEEAQAPLSAFYRHISKGAWPFSTRDHGWPISDCSSEGLKAALTLANLPKDKVCVYVGLRGVLRAACCFYVYVGGGRLLNRGLKGWRVRAQRFTWAISR